MLLKKSGNFISLLFFISVLFVDRVVSSWRGFFYSIDEISIYLPLYKPSALVEMARVPPNLCNNVYFQLKITIAMLHSDKSHAVIPPILFSFIPPILFSNKHSPKL